MLANFLTVQMNDAQWKAYLSVIFICLIVIFIAALIAIIVVMCQKSNSDGIQGITASSETFFGKNKGKSIESKLKKWSWILLGVIGVLSITIYIVQIVLL